MHGTLAGELRKALLFRGRPDPVLIGLLVMMNGLVLFNTVVYEPNFPSDASEFKRYTTVLAEGRLPDRTETREFFTPPLPFVLPAALLAAGVENATAMKLGQNVNVLYSAALLVVVLLLVEELRPGCRSAKRLALLLLAMLPIYQHAFIYMRGEPLLTLGSALALLMAARQLARPEWNPRPLAALGLVMGLTLLCRQQGIFVVLAVTAFAGLRLWVEPHGRTVRLRGLAICLTVAGAVGGWFYLSLWARHGTPMAFNKPRGALAFANRPPDFYFGTGNGKIFEQPVRPHFTGQFLPTLYADAWGDYYGYFLVFVFDHRMDRWVPPWEWEETVEEWRDRRRYRTNLFTRAPYLGRTNLLALLPTTLCLIALVRALRALPRLAGKDPSPASTLGPLVAFAILLTLVGYFLLLLSFPPVFARGTTIKAIYILPVFPLFAVLGADLLAHLRQRWPRIFLAAAAALVLLLVHNAPLLVTAFWPRP